jgi:hypothetical protein
VASNYLAIGLTIAAVGAIAVTLSRVRERGKYSVSELLWALAFGTLVTQRFTLGLLDTGGALGRSGVLTLLALAFAVAAIVVEYRLTGSILGAFGG